MSEGRGLVKSKQRVADHGEVFTPEWMVNDMLDLVKDESERIDARVLEPACGEGAFLQEVVRRKLASVQARYGESDFERRHYALLAVMCTYGIELLADNAEVCRANLLRIFTDFIAEDPDGTWERAARAVLALNIVCADALTMTVPSGEPLSFAEWGYLGAGKFQRRDFAYQKLTQRALFMAHDKSIDNPTPSLLEDGLEEGSFPLFSPLRVHPPMSVGEIGAEGGDAP